VLTADKQTLKAIGLVALTGVLTDALAAGADEAKRAFDAMMEMTKIDIAVIEAARRG
jgi:hypothetical protein